MEIVTEDLGSTDILERPIRVNNKDYVIREADGDTASKFRGMQMSHLKLSEGKAAGILPGLSESELYLAAKCLHEVIVDDTKGLTRRAVPLAVLKLWPDRITSRIFEIAQEISELKTPETADSLRKQINELQEKLDKLIADKEAGKEDDPAKNAQLKTADGIE